MYIVFCPEDIEEGRVIFLFCIGKERMYLSTDLSKKVASFLDFSPIRIAEKSVLFIIFSISFPLYPEA